MMKSRSMKLSGLRFEQLYQKTETMKETVLNHLGMHTVSLRLIKSWVDETLTFLNNA